MISENKLIQTCAVVLPWSSQNSQNVFDHLNDICRKTSIYWNVLPIWRCITPTYLHRIVLQFILNRKSTRFLRSNCQRIIFEIKNHFDQNFWSKIFNANFVTECVFKCNMKRNGILTKSCNFVKFQNISANTYPKIQDPYLYLNFFLEKQFTNHILSNQTHYRSKTSKKKKHIFQNTKISNKVQNKRFRQ